MQTRRKFLAAGAVAAVSAIGITLPESASAAMGARIDSPLRLLRFGVDVTGTISHWDADSKSAVFHTSIVQGSHSAHGVSEKYLAGATTWAAFAYGTLKAGKATGHATAVITNKDGSMETYKWTVPVVLR